MMYMVLGGSNSGKSEYAENILSKISGVKYKYYVATMRNSNEEAAKRIIRHRKLREGKGFITIEQPKDILKILDYINAEESAVLLECITNLTANEFFECDEICAEKVIQKIKNDIFVLKERVRHLIVVSNNSFDERYQNNKNLYDDDLNNDSLDDKDLHDDISDNSYDEDTAVYIKTLFAINDELAAFSDEIYQM